MMYNEFITRTQRLPIELIDIFIRNILNESFFEKLFHKVQALRK